MVVILQYGLTISRFSMVRIVPKEDLPVLPQKTVPEPLWSPSTSGDDWAAKRGRYLSGFLGPLEGFSMHWLLSGNMWIRSGRASALIWLREYKEGHATLSSGAPNWEAAGGVHNFPQIRTAFAAACLGMGQIEEAQSWVRAAIQLADQTGHRWYEAEAHRVLGDVQLALSDPAAAEFAFLRAIEVAKRQKAKSWELRAATSLARLWRDQDKRREAHDLLAPVYGWFTEGFDTPVLQEAKVLLDELSGSPAVVLAASP